MISDNEESDRELKDEIKKRSETNEKTMKGKNYNIDDDYYYYYYSKWIGSVSINKIFH